MEENETSTFISEIVDGFNAFGYQEFYSHYVDTAISVTRILRAAMQVVKQNNPQEHEEMLRTILDNDYNDGEILVFPPDERRHEMTMTLRQYILIYHHLLDNSVLWTPADEDYAAKREDLANSVINIALACMNCCAYYFFPLQRIYPLLEQELGEQELFDSVMAVMNSYPHVVGLLDKPLFRLTDYEPQDQGSLQ